MKKKTKKINYAAGIIFTGGAILMWILNFLGTERQRMYIELFFIAVYLPVLLLFLKYYFCKEKKRIEALKKKIERDKKRSKRKVKRIRA